MMKKILRRPTGWKTVTQPRSAEEVMASNPATQGLLPYRGSEATCGLIQRPWGRFFNSECPETIFLMTRQNHRVYAYVGLNPRAMIRKVVF